MTGRKRGTHAVTLRVVGPDGRIIDDPTAVIVVPRARALRPADSRRARPTEPDVTPSVTRDSRGKDGGVP